MKHIVIPVVGVGGRQSPPRRVAYWVTLDTERFIAPGEAFALVSAPLTVCEFAAPRFVCVARTENGEVLRAGFEVAAPQRSARQGETITVTGRNVSDQPLRIVVSLIGFAIE